MNVIAEYDIIIAKCMPKHTVQKHYAKSVMYKSNLPQSGAGVSVW